MHTSSGGSVLTVEEASKLLTTLFLMAALGSAAIAVATVFVDEPHILLLAANSTLAFSALFFLAQGKRVSLAGSLGSGYLIALIVFAMVTGNGIRDLTMPVFGFVVLLANLVLKQRLAQLATIGAWLAIVGVACAEYAQVFQTPLSFRTTFVSVLVLATVQLAIALAARRLVRAFHEGIDRAHVQELSYSHIFNATGEAIFLIDPTSERIIDANQSAQTMFGLERQELLRSSLQQLAGKKQSAAPIIDTLQSGMRGEPKLFDWKVHCKDGSAIPVEVSVRPAVVGAKEVILAVIRDASEKRRIEAKLHESEKLRAVGQLAGGIAHDFNNQLTGILANASLLREKITDPRLAKCADVIVRCSRRSSDLTSQLLAFARRGKHQNVGVDVHELVGEVVELLKHSIDKRITLVLDLTTEELQVVGDPTLLQNALLNLGLNACDAMPQGGTLSFRTRLENVEITQIGVASALHHGEYARVEVQDTGNGMDEATVKHVFEPFFTTKKGGHGMGLAAVYGAVESHRGDISLETEVGKGTTFTILLPLSQGRRESVTLKVHAPSQKFTGIRVLLAEDEDDVAFATQTLLEDLGCEVTRCRDGQEAVEVFSDHPDDFDLALFDHMMPRLSGREALRKLRAIRSQLPALLTSGYSTETVIEGELDAEFFLPKPFNANQLSASLSRVLEPSQDRLTQ